MTRLTSDPNDPDIKRGSGDTKPVPQNDAYLVLSEEELKIGFVRPLRRTYLHENCGSVTTMSYELAATYACEPNFYGATYCCNCQMHRPVGENGEFVWESDGTKVGT